MQKVRGKCSLYISSLFLAVSILFLVTIPGLARANQTALSPFAALYAPVDAPEHTPSIPGYELPLDPNKIVNWSTILFLFPPYMYYYCNFNNGSFYYPLAISTPGDTWKVLFDQGFVVAHPKEACRFNIVGFYELLKKQDIPIFITSDTLLHLYHVQFDETLLDIEGGLFYPDFITMTEALLSESKTQYENFSGDLKEAARRNEAFFTVALKLLKPTEEIPVSSYIQDEVSSTLSSVGAHAGFGNNPIFKYKEDYSQYIPRGHYTRTETLKRYFRAVMWYGRMAFLLKGGDNPGNTQANDALISKEDARIQTLQAAMIAEAMSRIYIQGKSLFDLWQRIYMVTSFYVGLSDDLTPSDYLQALDEVFGGQNIDISTLAASEEMMNHLKANLALLPSPQIYGGTGAIKITPSQGPLALNADLLNDFLDKTIGMRFMGQRYVPDSYIMNQLVSPAVSFLEGGPCFTTSETVMGPVRGFPRGLDVMAVFGSKRAKSILEAFGDTYYVSYDEQFEMLKNQFDTFGEEEWNKNLYWSWLYCLKTLFERPGPGYPTFMQTDAWQDKQLNTALASWTELRHDTVLCAKQGYTSDAFEGPPMVVGYVEPVPKLYARLLSLTKMLNQGLSQLGCLSSVAGQRLNKFEDILQRLLDISIKELKNEILSSQDYYFINNFSDHLEDAALNVTDKGLDHRLVVDVHTDMNTDQVLEEAIGDLDIMLVAYKVPDGGIVVGAGPVLSYYEFKQPMANRLDDNGWYGLLYTSNCPSRPQWCSSFCLDKENKDLRSSLPYVLSLREDNSSASFTAFSNPYYAFDLNYGLNYRLGYGLGYGLNYGLNYGQSFPSYIFPFSPIYPYYQFYPYRYDTTGWPGSGDNLLGGWPNYTTSTYSFGHLNMPFTDNLCHPFFSSELR